MPDTPERQANSAIARINEAEVRAGRDPVSAKAAAKAAAQKKLEREQRALRARQAGNQRANVPVQRKPEVHQEPEVIEFDLDASIREMSRENIECRDLRHSWRPFSARWMARGNYFEDILRCARCGTERVRHIGARGQVLSSHYEYADGYLMTGSGRMTTDMNESLRLASLRTRLVKDTVQE